MVGCRPHVTRERSAARDRFSVRWSTRMVMLLDGAEQRDLRVGQFVGHSGPSGSAPPILPDRHQACVAAGRGGVGGGRAFLDEVGEIVILAGGEAGAGQRLEPHDRPGAARELAQRPPSSPPRRLREARRRGQARSMDPRRARSDARVPPAIPKGARSASAALTTASLPVARIAPIWMRRAAFARRDRRDAAAPPKRIDIALADRAFELDPRAERRARHHSHAPLGLRAHGHARRASRHRRECRAIAASPPSTPSSAPGAGSATRRER